jgi:tetratricopeptide (TPR) repeat protein
LSSGQSDSAEEAFSQAIARDPRDAEAYVMRARARSRRSDFAKALDDADTALGYEPDDLGALREKGAALLGMGQCAEACNYLRRTTDHPHAEAEAFFLYGVALLQSGAADKAARSLTASLSLAPLSAAALFHRGRAYQLLGKHTRAQQDLEKARQLDPIIEQRVTT